MSQSPRSKRLVGNAPARATAVTGSATLFSAPFDATIESVLFVPDALLTGADTNTRRIAVVNKGQAGAGVIEPAALQFNAAVNAPAFDEKPLTLSGTPANLEVTEGDVLAVVSTAVGTGLADPGGVIVVKFARRPTAV